MKGTSILCKRTGSVNGDADDLLDSQDMKHVY